MEIQRLRDYVKSSLETKEAAFREIGPKVIDAAVKIRSRLHEGHKLLICGNGGSAADAQHFAAEIVCRFEKERPGFPALCLNTNTSVLTAWSNDYSFDGVFARQIEAFARPGDLLIAISTSGDSLNVVNAAKQAKSQGIFTIGLLGKDGGKLRDLVELPIVIPSDRTAFVQECHIMIYHFWCEVFEADIDGAGNLKP